MTSGVKQAVPQVLMPKTGVEGKAARIGAAPQADFAEMLGIGKSAKQLKSSEARAGRQDVEAKPLWQRLAAKLETAAEHSQEIAAKLEAAAGLEHPEADERGDDKVGEHHEDSDLKDPATSPAARQAADTAQPPAFPPASTPAPAETAGQPTSQRHTPTSHEASLPVDRELIADGDSPNTSSSPASDTARKQDAAAPIFVPMGRGEQSGPIRFEPAAGPAAAAAEQSSSDRTQATEPSPEASAEPAKTAPRVTVLAQQSIPAPMPQTSVVLVESIAASNLLDPARNPPALDAIHASATHASAQSLKIQLHPAELGMVTATLRFAGEQLSIELQVENHEAYRRLSGDSDAIVNSLRELGYEVDRVTVLQPSLASTSAGRSDPGASMPSPQGRAPEQFGSGAGPGGNGGSGDRKPGDGGNAGGGGQQHPAASREQQGGGLYI